MATPYNGQRPVITVRDASCRMAPASAGAGPESAKNGAGFVFRGIDLDVHPGEVMDLVGPSGGGKSSLLTCIAQLNPRATATLTLDGADAGSMSVEQWRTKVAYLPQKSFLPGTTVAQAIALPYTFAALHGATAPTDAQIRAALDAVGLADVELARDPHDLSGGQAARVSMIRSILTAPRVLLADEVDAGLDDDSARLVGAYMVDFAHRTGMAMIRVRHRPPDGLADTIATLANGALAVRPAAESEMSAANATPEANVVTERSAR
ncbi:MAG: ATP-binding cassette domain-containing protein [Bifidobacteriaceae bacterium]|nr:ATP-binding cassette domain-containing protein [Bifidobacteriaceae bacterium]